MSGEKLYPRFITMRIIDDVCPDGHDPVSALLVNANTAVTIISGELEVCRVQATSGEGLYDLEDVYYPAIYAGKDEEFAFHDLLNLTAAEFFGKYPCYGEYVKSALHYHKEEVAYREQVHPHPGFEML